VALVLQAVKHVLEVDNHVGTASLMGFVREERSVNATEDDERVRGTNHLTDATASKGVARMHADSQIAGMDGGVAMIACLNPTHRAMSVNPLGVLRYE